MPITARTPVTCEYRTTLESATGDQTHCCGLARQISGAKDESLFPVSQRECEFCCKKREPMHEAPNGLVASVLSKALEKIIELEGVDGCTREHAEVMLPAAGMFLQMASPTGPVNDLPVPRRLLSAPPCRYLGRQSGSRKCKTCKGNVQLKVFHCRHPEHEETTLRECARCADYQQRSASDPVEFWAIGVTAAPRESSTLDRTLASLRKGGWDETVHLFSEQGTEPELNGNGYGSLVNIERREPALGAWGNFYLALCELYLRDPDADAYFLLQDDVVFTAGLRTYLEETLWMNDQPAVVFLHTPSHLAPEKGTGFFPASLGWSAWGAQAMVFSNSAVRRFLSDLDVVEHRQKGIFDGRKNVDSVIGDWCSRNGIGMWLHAPSLAEHIGSTSTLWSRADLTGKRSSADFPGEDVSVAEALEVHRRSHGESPPPALVKPVARPGNRARNRGGSHRTKLIPADGERDCSIAVVVTAHESYLHFLPECLAAWDAQQPDRKVLVLDDCQYEAPEGWQVIEGDWHHPNPARNAGVADCAGVSWIIHWDADNVPPSGFVDQARLEVAHVAEDVGVIYPGVEVGGRDLRANGYSPTNDPDPREDFFIDTASVWRRDAIQHVGGWSSRGDKLDDWHLACRLHDCGWQLRPMKNATVTVREHKGRRTHGTSVQGAVWQVRSLGIVVLFAGRTALLERFFESLRSLELPQRVGLTVVDDSGDDDFHDRLQDGLRSIASRFRRVSILRSDTADKPSDYEAVHARVGRLYSAAIASSPEPVLLTWEDDVFPRLPDAIRLLSAQMLPKAGVGAVSGAYRSRQGDQLVVGSREVQRWGNMPTFAWLGEEVKPVGMVGGGYTLWSRAALEQCPIFGGAALADGGRLGWDGDVCRRMQRADWRILLHGGVQCAHDYQE